MRFKMRTSSRIVVLLVVMVTSQICHPSLAYESRDLIDDRATDKFARSERYYPVRNRNIEEELRPYVLEQVRNRIFPPIQPGYRDDLPQPSGDFPLEEPPPLYSINGRQRPPPPYEGPQQHALNPNGDILPPPPAYDRIFPNGPQRRQSLSPSGRTRLVSNQAGPSTLEIDSMEARIVFTVILPQIQRERPTLQEMRLKGQVHKTDANNYEFVFKASDIVREGGRRKIVKCGVRATRHGLGLRDFGVSGLTCDLPRRSLRGRGRSERYYPVRNRNFEKEFQSNDLKQVRNRIFPENLNWLLRPGAPRTEHPPPPQDLPEHLPGAPPMEDDPSAPPMEDDPSAPDEPSGARPSQAGPSQARPSGAWPPQVGPPPQAWPPQTIPIQPGHRGDLPQPSEDYPLVDPPPPYSEIQREVPPPPYDNLGQPAPSAPSAADIHLPPPAYDQIYPNVPRPAAAGLVQSILGLGQHVLGQIAEAIPRPNLNPRPNPAPVNILPSADQVRRFLRLGEPAPDQDARRIFELITPKIQRERQTLQDMQMKVATKIEGTPSYEFGFEAMDIVRPGGRHQIVKCRVRANPTPMIRDFTISALTCEQKGLNNLLLFTYTQYYPAARGKRASPNKIHNRVSPSIQRRRSGSVESASSNDDHPPPSYDSVVGLKPPSYQSLFPGSAQPENPSRSSSLSSGSGPEAFIPMGQTYIHKNSPEAKRVFAAIKPQLLQQHSEFRKIRLAPRVLKQELASSSSPFSVNYKFTLTATVLVKQRPFYRQDKVHRIPCLVQVYKTNASLNVYEMLCTCSSY